MTLDQFVASREGIFPDYDEAAHRTVIDRSRRLFVPWPGKNVAGTNVPGTNVAGVKVLPHE